MKIAFLAPFGIRPKGTLIARMLPIAIELKKVGHDMVMIAPPYTNPEDSGLTETVRGIRLVNIRLSYSGAIGAPIMAWRMYQATMRERPDVIHLFKPKGYGGLAVMLMQLFATCGVRMPRLFVDCDDLEGKGGMNDLKGYGTCERILFNFQEQFIPRHVQGVTVASRMLANEMQKTGVTAAGCQYLPNGIGGERSAGDGQAVRRRAGIPDDVPVLLLYTRFFEFNQQRLYSILENLIRTMPECRILVVGKGPDGEEQALMRAAVELGFSDALIMAGWLEPVDIPDYLAAGDVALYLLDDTLVNRAKCPAKLTELLAAGIPVVVDRIGQAAEYTADVASTRYADDSELVERLVALLNDEGLRRSVGKTAREYILQHFEWTNLVKELDQFYQKTSSRH